MEREIPVLYKRKEECCGCTACYAICPKEAISMVEDEEGFEYKGRGFRYGLKKSGVEWPSWDFDESNIKEENVEAFKKIVKYCKDNDIELICVQSALPPFIDESVTFANQKMRERGGALAEMVMEKLKAVAGKCLIESASVEFMSFIEDAYRCLKSR